MCVCDARQLASFAPSRSLITHHTSQSPYSATFMGYQTLLGYQSLRHQQVQKSVSNPPSFSFSSTSLNSTFAQQQQAATPEISTGALKIGFSGRADSPRICTKTVVILVETHHLCAERRYYCCCCFSMGVGTELTLFFQAYRVEDFLQRWVYSYRKQVDQKRQSILVLRTSTMPTQKE